MCMLAPAHGHVCHTVVRCTRADAVQMVNADEVDEEDDEEYNDFPVGDQIFRVSTAGTEEKTNALSMLSCYAEHMGEHFAPYCLDIAAIAEHVLSAPLLNTELMRRTCASLVPQLLRCMQSAVEKKSLPQATPETVVQLFELLMKGLLSVRPPPLPACMHRRSCSRGAVSFSTATQHLAQASCPSGGRPRFSFEPCRSLP